MRNAGSRRTYEGTTVVVWSRAEVLLCCYVVVWGAAAFTEMCVLEGNNTETLYEVQLARWGGAVDKILTRHHATEKQSNLLALLQERDTHPF